MSDVEKVLPWQCSKIEQQNGVANFQIFLEGSWWQAVSIDSWTIAHFLYNEKALSSAFHRCTDIIPEHYQSNPSSYSLLKCWVYMMTVAFPKVYQKVKALPDRSTVKLLDDYANEMTRELNWTKDNFKKNKDCVLQAKSKPSVHHSGQQGSNVPTFNLESTLAGPTPMVSDIGFKTANMFKESNEIFHQIEETFDPLAMIRQAEEQEHVGSIKHKDKEQELDKLKHQSAVETMRLKMETMRLHTANKKLSMLQDIEFQLIFIIVLLVGMLVQICQGKKDGESGGVEKRYEDSLMSNF